MRTYYIFNINKEMSILTKDTPYILYKSLESIYKMGDLYTASNLYEQLATKFNKNKVNSCLSNNYKDNDFYQHYNNHHLYYNKYKNENCTLDVKNSYLLCTSNSSRLVLLNKLTGYNFFVCDFQNKDYFWLSQMYC